MSNRNRTQATVGLALAVLATLAVTACDPFIQANKDAPAVIGVLMYDINLNLTVADPPGGCSHPYPEPAKAWADATWPGVCNPGNIAFGSPTVCPVFCYPPRTGPAFAPFFTGNTAGTYAKDGGGTYTYTESSATVITGSPIYYEYDTGVIAAFSQIRIMFNKLLDGATIQGAPTPVIPCPVLHTPDAPKIYVSDTDVTDQFNVCYVPNSDNGPWGGQITFTPKAIDETWEVPLLDPNTTYEIRGKVGDQQGNSYNLLVSVSTIDPVVPSAVKAK